jgi:hypothetical protein
MKVLFPSSELKQQVRTFLLKKRIKKISLLKEEQPFF